MELSLGLVAVKIPEDLVENLQLEEEEEEHQICPYETLSKISGFIT